MKLQKVKIAVLTREVNSLGVVHGVLDVDDVRDDGEYSGHFHSVAGQIFGFGRKTHLKGEYSQWQIAEISRFQVIGHRVALLRSTFGCLWVAV